jgi:hypothetical protein
MKQAASHVAIVDMRGKEAKLVSGADINRKLRFISVPFCYSGSQNLGIFSVQKLIIYYQFIRSEIGNIKSSPIILILVL